MNDIDIEYDKSLNINVNRSKRVRKCSIKKHIELDNRKGVNYSKDFDSCVESEQWNRFYSDKSLSNTPFYGLSTDYSANLLFKILNKSNYKLLLDDIIVEVGHGKHPLVDKIREYFKINNIYIGVEFSSIAIKEAIANCTIKHLNGTQFVTPCNINYYKNNGDFNGMIIHSTIGNECLLKTYCSRLVIGRCLLDYITSRLLTSIGIVSWDDDLRIPNSIITMFDTFTNTLSNNSAIVFIEPFDEVKIQDHILTLFKVICVSTFVEKSESRFLSLNKIIFNNNMGIICYMLIKTDREAKDYEEVYNNFKNVTKNKFKSYKSSDDDWLLPTKMPKAWSSNDEKFFDVLTSFNLNV